MFNTVLNSKVVEKMQEVIKVTKEYEEVHLSSRPNVGRYKTEIEMVHTAIYLDGVRDLIKATSFLESLLEVSPEEFEKTITNNGKLDVKEIMKNIMFKHALDMFS